MDRLTIHASVENSSAPQKLRRAPNTKKETDMAELLKLAWHRDQDVPAGQRAPGTLTCPCGHIIHCNYDPDPHVRHTCKCGTVYTGTGWIVGTPRDATATAAITTNYVINRTNVL